MTPTAEFIATWEGLATVRPDGLVYPYIDIVGVKTVGYGFTQRAVVESAPHTIKRMQLLLDHECWERELMALRASPCLALPGNELRLQAVVSFIFNLGIGSYERSTLRRRVNAQDWPGAQIQIKRWVYAGGKPVRGLRRRRAAEAALLA